MSGYIKGRDVLKHSTAILRGFGVRCYLCCLKAMLIGQHKTFLDCAFPLVEEAAPHHRPPRAKESAS